MSLRSMPIATRAALSFALITALLVITGIFSLNRMGSLNEASSDISDNWLPSVRESAELNVLLAELRQVQLAHVLAADDSSKRFLESRMTEIGKELTDREGAYQRLISGADERSIYERYLATRQTLLQSQQTLVQMSRSKPLEETRQYTESTLLDQYRATQQQLQALIDFNVKGASQASHTADEVLSQRLRRSDRRTAGRRPRYRGTGLAVHPQHHPTARRGAASGRGDRFRRPHQPHRHLWPRRTGQAAGRPPGHAGTTAPDHPADRQLGDPTGLRRGGTQRRHRAGQPLADPAERRNPDGRHRGQRDDRRRRGSGAQRQLHLGRLVRLRAIGAERTPAGTGDGPS